MKLENVRGKSYMFPPMGEFPMVRAMPGFLLVKKIIKNNYYFN